MHGGWGEVRWRSEIICVCVVSVTKRQSFSALIYPLSTPLTQIKMHMTEDLPLCMGDGGE